MKRALVTGGASPIGAAICRRLAADGLHVIVHANRSMPQAEQVATAIRESGGSAGIWGCDIADTAATRDALAALLAGGVPQVIVHNAGTHDDVTMAGMTEAQWRGVLSVSLDGFFNVVQPLLLPMTRTRWGRIIALSSVSARLGNRGQVNYAAAKAGLEGAVRSLAREVGSRGITVNAIAPGIIDSPATVGFTANDISAIVPARRLGRPDEVADLVAFVASDQAAYISGQTIGINGGMA
ncbi:3-oxoacyl-ACP reductase FabG [Acidomonas methanolica]|uniref:Oxidoreductase/short-chain dehydrogenase/reductase SDR n=1 Tax=Acidomonas methanolica NBRC 104435 TaxID=1231351 RepID=A0A023D7U2_ACIMT|nr:3-oxoacyl-ACP reductase FabG [Acidomonas methanolica]MBU2653785.1 3-oxoacyl-ACP reductase FabG [Acidomonas methanolica]TCS31739.1 3-oxoacyl-[acyl-carrier protein] reductase [Acidomonas methanolica]GAJ30203.1 oxidoreductase/short-chain dehydrogenase/reductase SDR [Acidomonas methanolica NBRC 104435]GBQ50731.1 3-ketoacyl-ACP reductase [Acidomonas methanolica]GEK98155.1 3-ketoacyl-ACP reductase [Acidomonas methanolica NBRC 104435]